MIPLLRCSLVWGYNNLVAMALRARDGFKQVL